MNIITRLSLIFAIASLLIFLAGGIITYRVMEREIYAEQQWFLIERLADVTRFIQRRQPTEQVQRSKMIIYPLSDDQSTYDPVFSDTLVNHTTLDRLEPHLKLETVQEIDGKKYRIVLFDVIVESDDIVDGVVESLLIIYSILLTTVIIIGVIASYFVLRPFGNTLRFIQSFSVSTGQAEVKLKHSRLPEFRKLNMFLDEMTQQITCEYRSLKEFSENASHELKTPLAIIQGKLEQLINDPDTSESQLEHLSSIQNTLKRLNRLSDSMVLLTKIDNNEFTRKEDVNLSKITTQLVEDFRELIELKSIKLDLSIDDHVKVRSDQTLLEVMVSNLLINAIKYNHPNGKIILKLNAESLSVENSGEPLVVDPSSLFKRFKKSSNADQSLGLGLAIVKKICDFSGFSVEYLNNSKQHTVIVCL